MSHYLFAPMPAYAQASVQPPAEIRAQKFVLVDENGTPRGEFGFRNDGSPDIQIGWGKPRGLAKLIGGSEAGSARWLGVDRKDVLPDLRLTHP